LAKNLIELKKVCIAAFVESCSSAFCFDTWAINEAAFVCSSCKIAWRWQADCSWGAVHKVRHALL